ncbi:cell division protein FtsZ [Litorimonas taeanensis]|uniref:Cell division protein FtsZ n=1 Tax=Litorimonas taeanensis TaxID=568099 RepID=A0A420WL11_9PROT|nr:cell division protein FtsZ [Litorimonas taeanensis]RKQ71707.1 cell division protein FtsZ [Litorimonas taeanensis]
MTLNLSLPKAVELKPRIVVIGVGGAGGNAVNNMISAGLDGVDFVVANTDAQALALSRADRRVQMGGGVTQGLGAGMRPEVGEEAAEDSLDEIMEHLDGAHMLFVAAGMGGGTGTGAAPVIARAARERNILTVGIVTKPFMFEGSRRMKLAEQGIENLYASVDTMITIPNQNLFRVATENTTMSDAFAMADEVLHSGVRGVTDLMVVPGLINLDFNDVRTIMAEMGKAMMGTGEATGDRRAVEAAESAINNPLLDDVSLKGARGVLINITGGNDLTLYEVDEAASLIRGQVDEDANIIVGSALDNDLDGIIRVSVVATGVDTDARAETPPAPFKQKPSQESRLQPLTAEGAAAVAKEQGNVFNPVADMQKEVEQKFIQETAEETPTPPPYVAPRPYPPQIDSTAQAPIETIAPQPSVQQAPPAPRPSIPEPAQRSAFGLFGGFRKKAPQAPIKTQTTAAPMGDLFGDDMEDELEIPSFLRRQSR